MVADTLEVCANLAQLAAPRASMPGMYEEMGRESKHSQLLVPTRTTEPHILVLLQGTYLLSHWHCLKKQAATQTPNTVAVVQTDKQHRATEHTLAKAQASVVTAIMNAR